MFVCEFCNKTLSSKYTLKTHQQKTKSCLTLQKERGISIPTSTFECSYCNKHFNIKVNCNRHETTCKLKDDFEKERSRIEINNIKAEKEGLKEENIKLNMKNSELTGQLTMCEKMNDKLEKMASKPRNVNNTVNNTINFNGKSVDLSDQNISSKLSCYDESIYDKGPAGFADLVREKILTDENGELLCGIADRARKIIKYNVDGMLIKDEKANMLKSKLITFVKPMMKEIKKKRFRIICEIEDPDIENEYMNTESNKFNKNMFKGQEFENRLVYTIECNGVDIEEVKEEKPIVALEKLN